MKIKKPRCYRLFFQDPKSADSKRIRIEEHTARDAVNRILKVAKGEDWRFGNKSYIFVGAVRIDRFGEPHRETESMLANVLRKVKGQPLIKRGRNINV